MPTHSIADIAKATGLAMVGDGTLRVARACPPDAAESGDLAIALSETYADGLSASSARAAVLWDGADYLSYGLDAALIAARPRVAMAGITRVFQHDDAPAPGIDANSAIHPSAEIGEGAAIGPFCIIGAGARIGANAQICGQVTIGANARIGRGTVLRPGVRIGARCRVGDDVLIHENAVIGADGFSFEPPRRGSVEAAKSDGKIADVNDQGFLRIHSLAAVTIGDNVEIGAVSAIDRGTLSDTRVGNGTKIDNQVQIGHNVQVGANCLLCAQVGIAGSAVVGDRVVLGGKVGIGDHIRIGEDVVCAGGTLIASNVPARSIMMGVPGTQRDQAIRQVMALRRLPRLMDQIAEMRKKLGL